MTGETRLEERGYQQPFDAERAGAFAGEVVGLVNSTALTFMISVGHQAGLFDTMAELPPSTSEQIASAAGLNERYVREWLGAMVTGRVVEYDPVDGTYRLPPEHAASLTRSAGTDNFATLAMFFPEFGKVEQQIVRCFRDGGGVAYAEFERFHDIMSEESAKTFDAALIDVILPLVPGIREGLARGIEVADVGCGLGHAVNVMARAYPKSGFVGYDIAEDAIRAAQHEAEAWGLRNAHFEVRDAAHLGVRDRFDLVTAFDAIHDQAQPAAVLEGIYDATKGGGYFLCADIAASSRLEENLEHPLGPFIYAISTMHCMTVSLASGGAGLGTAWGEQMAVEMMTDTGFEAIEVKQVEGDIANNYYVASRPITV